MAAKAALPVQIFGRRFGQLRAAVTAQNVSALRLASQRLYTTEKQPEEATGQTPEQKATAGAASPEVEKLTKDLAAAKEQNAELLDKYKRALADSENMRNRLNKQISDAKIFGIQSFCKDLLEVADTLGHATQAVPKEKLSGNADLKNLYEGLSMTRASLLQVFKRHGLEPLDPINQKFDPNLHEALFQKEDKTVEANTVVEVTKLGYKLHERCIRPALVGVSKC
ncbi:hypothetical protein KR067_013505 [Drosophila pandora]|nr:hypothetical protein KR067_013505 [Drosophila pandora]